MKLGLRELLRRPGRFGAATLILFLIAALLMFLGGLSDGLNGNNDGAVRSQEADLVVFAASAQRSISQSVVDAATRASVSTVPGVEAVGRLSLVQLGARIPGRDPRDLVDVAVLGYDLAFGTVPADLAPGEAWADASLRRFGVDAGTTILVGPARTPVTIAGFVDNAGFQGQPSLWLGADAQAAVVAANKPDAVLPAGGAKVLLVEAAPGADRAAVAAAIDAATATTATVTVRAAADAIEDVDGGTLTTIGYMTVAIAVAIVALFFALLTAERLGLYGVLKAIGARTATIFAGVVTQAVVLTLIGAAVATAVAITFDRLVPAGEIPFTLTGARIVSSVGLLLVASVLGAAFSLRRVLRIDPASAIGSAS